MTDISAYCSKCNDDKEHSVKKMIFGGRKIELELDCGHTIDFYGSGGYL